MEGKWYCKYCKKTVSLYRSFAHRLTKTHRIKARWYKYFEEVDRAISVIKDQYDHGVISLEEFNQMEEEIYNQVDMADVNGYFYNLPDSD